ncbi:MAG: hypothetical protein M3Q49_06205 [Actinomycetota bacterium]|nr:hypothetical protein [Actinomycetota bacterium]
MSRKEMARLLTSVGFKASENNVSQWLNGDRTPPPGLPYYATLALKLEEDDAHALAWSYTRTYRDNRKGAGRSGKKAVPTEPGLTEENEIGLEAARRRKAELDEEILRERGERDTGDRAP